MVALAADITADQEWIALSEADSLSLAVGYYTIDSENVYVDTGAHPASSISNPIPKYNGRRAVRGRGGSTPATHSSGATLTRYYVDGPPSGGSGILQGGPLTEDLDADGFGVSGHAQILVDPGNVWEAETAVVEGYRITVTTHVFEIFMAGTTDETEPTPWSLVGEGILDGTAAWRYIGEVGGLPMTSATDYITAAMSAALAGQTVPLTSPTVQDVIDALVAGFGLVQSD